MTRVRPALLLIAALLLGLPSTARPAPQDDGDPATARWDQYGGNSARTFASSVEPVRSAPRVAWKAGAAGFGTGNTVAWEGTLFQCTESSSVAAVLRAVSLVDGRILATKDLGKAGGATIAVAQGMVVVADDSGLRGFQLQGNSFSLRWTVKGKHPFPPAVLDDVVHSVSGGFLNAVHPLTGKAAGEPAEFATECAPSLARERGRNLAAGVTTGGLKGYVGTYAYLRSKAGRIGANFGRFRDEGSAPVRLHLCRLSPEGADRGGWLLHSSAALAGVEDDYPCSILPDHGGADDGGLVPIASPPTVYKGSAIGFSRDGTLVAVRANGLFSNLVERKDLPPGTRPGPASRARNTAYFGNWALDLDTRRVLWSLPDLKPAGPLLPVANRVLIAVTESGELLCLTDRPEAGSAVSPGAAVPAQAAAPPLPPPLSGDGLLLEDGTSVEGPVEELPGGRFRVAPPGGPPREEGPEGLLLARGGGKVLRRGRESAVLARWRRTLHPGAVDALMGIHLRMARDGLHEAAAAVLADAATFGLPADRAAEATRRAGSVKQNGFPAKILAELEPDFRKVRAASRDGFLSASDWCRDRGFPAAATCLLIDAGRILPGYPGMARKVSELVPPAFPFVPNPEAGSFWMEWAREIVDADAEFHPSFDSMRKYIDDGPWSRKESLIILRTPNVIFWSRVLDPVIVGRCLRNAEATCRALTVLIGTEGVARVRSDQDRMVVRLHATEADYRAESAEDGDTEDWSAGSFSPSEGISRFFVPGPEARDPLGRGLFEVLAHELTHHFLELRWRPTRERRRGSASDPGYWAIEGIARFVEDQAVEMDRRGLRFDDRTAPSLEAAAQAAGKNVLFRPSRLLAMSHADFGTLSDRELLRVRLRNTLEGRILSPIGLFYEQAGATAYFLVMERGEEGRRAFFRYLSDVYAGKAEAEGWKALGFTSAEEFDGAVKGFLAGLR